MNYGDKTTPYLNFLQVLSHNSNKSVHQAPYTKIYP
jgi:hypothetical protein